jgi:hypothetical protein
VCCRHNIKLALGSGEHWLNVLCKQRLCISGTTIWVDYNFDSFLPLRSAICLVQQPGNKAGSFILIKIGNSEFEGFDFCFRVSLFGEPLDVGYDYIGRFGRVFSPDDVMIWDGIDRLLVGSV